jgi:hypothetical protein
MVTVKSLLPVAVELHLDRLIEDELGDQIARRRHGSEVTLRPGLNAVDSAFWDAWSAAHRGSSLAEHFRLIEPAPEPEATEIEAAPEPEAAAIDPLLREPSPWAGGSIS